MKWLIGCLLCWNSALAQVSFHTKDSSIIKEIELPSQQPFDTAHAYHRVLGPYVYISSDNDLYSYFGYDIAMKYYKLKFGSFHILGEYQCRQCLENCRHDEGIAACHRNVCMKEWVWVMRENSKAFIEIPLSLSPGHIGPGLPRDHRPFFGDSVIRGNYDSGISRWYTHGQGDCFATFKYKIFQDNYHPVILLKEWNYWGGCRAGGSFDFTLSFKMPEGILYTIKNRVLMDKLGDGVEDQ